MKHVRRLPSCTAEAVHTGQPGEDVDQSSERDLERRSLGRIRELTKGDPVEELAHDENFVPGEDDLTNPADVRVSQRSKQACAGHGIGHRGVVGPPGTRHSLHDHEKGPSLTGRFEGRPSRYRARAELAHPLEALRRGTPSSVRRRHGRHAVGGYTLFEPRSIRPTRASCRYPPLEPYRSSPKWQYLQVWICARRSMRWISGMYTGLSSA